MTVKSGRRTNVGELAVVADNLTKVYRSGREAVAGLCLDVAFEEIVGLLGPNGAGKTTTMRMLSGVLPPSSGSAHVVGFDVKDESKEVRRRIGVVPQANWFDIDLTAYENLVVFARYFGMSLTCSRERARAALAFAQLEERASSKVEQLSGGMLRRLAIARALINDPELLIMDEPTTGLDPQSRQALWEYLFKLRSAGKAILLSTHYMEEAEAVCGRIYIMDHGRIIAQGSPATIVNEFEDRYTVTVMGSTVCVAAAARLLADAGHEVEELEGRAIAFVSDPDAAHSLLLGRGILDRGRCAVSSRLMTLEDVFLRLAGRGLRDL